MQTENITPIQWRYLIKNKVGYLVERFQTMNNIKPKLYTCLNCGKAYDIELAKNNHKLNCPNCTENLKFQEVFNQCFPEINFNATLKEKLGYKILDPKMISFTFLIPRDDFEYLKEIAEFKKVNLSSVIREFISKDKRKTKRRGFIK